MRIAILGAGIAGLGTAYLLKKQGVESVVFEKSKGLGGRCATRRLGPYTFDTGATSIAPRGHALEQVMLKDLPTHDLIEITKPVWTMSMGRVAPGDAAKMSLSRYCYQAGLTTLAKLLADGIEVRLEAFVDRYIVKENGVEINGELFDGLVLTMPTPQADEIMSRSGDAVRERNGRYRACLSVLLGYDSRPDELPYFALVDVEQRQPMIWLSHEWIKAPASAPDGHSAMVAQFGPQYSLNHYEDSDAEIAREAMTAISRLYGDPFAQAAEFSVKRWKYAQPEGVSSFEKVNPPGTRVWLTGDAFYGPRVELAFDSAVAVTRQILNS